MLAHAKGSLLSPRAARGQVWFCENWHFVQPMPFLFLILTFLLISLKLHAIKFNITVWNFIKPFLTKKPARNIWGFPNLSYSMCPILNRRPTPAWETAWNIIFRTISQKYFLIEINRDFSDSFLPFFLASTPPKARGGGRKHFFQQDACTPRLWILKRRILFHTLPNLLCLPQLSPYLLFLPLLDDYFLSSSLFFFPLVFSCLCCSGFTIWFCSPYRSPSLCHNPRFPPLAPSPSLFLLSFPLTPFLSYFPQGFQREAQPGPAFPSCLLLIEQFMNSQFWWRLCNFPVRRSTRQGQHQTNPNQEIILEAESHSSHLGLFYFILF